MGTRISLLCLLGLLVACGSDDAPADPVGTTTGPGSTSTESGSGEGQSDSTSPEEGDSSSSGEAAVPLEVWRSFAGQGNATALCMFDDDLIAVATSSATSVDSGSAAVRVFSPDGDEVWATGFGEAGAATYLHGIDCAPDGSVVAVGLQGDGGKFSSPRALMVRFDATGNITLGSVAPEVPSSELYGVHVDESGFFAVGPGSVVARFDSEGTERWRESGSFAGASGTFHDVLFADGVLYAAGQTGDAGWLVAMSDEGEVRWTETFNWASEVSADILTPAPGGGVLVVGRIEQSGFDNPDFGWVLPCDARGCEAEPLEAARLDRLYGFAPDADGGWVVNDPRELEARSADGAELWSVNTDFDWGYHTDYRQLLAIDSNGAIVVAGGDPAAVLKLEPPARSR